MLRAGCVPLKIDPPPFPPNLVQILFRKSFPDHSTGKKDRKKKEKDRTKHQSKPWPIRFQLFAISPGKSSLLGEERGRGEWVVCAQKNRTICNQLENFSSGKSLATAQQLGSSGSLIDFNPWPSQAIDFIGSVEEIGRKLFWKMLGFWILEDIVNFFLLKFKVIFLNLVKWFLKLT